MRFWTRSRLAISALVLAFGGCAFARPDLALRTNTGTTAHDLCSETFVSGLDPDQTFAESLRPRAGFGLVAWSMQVAVDREHREVRTSLAGMLGSRARFRD